MWTQLWLCVGISIFIFYFFISNQVIFVNYEYIKQIEIGQEPAAIDETALFSTCVLAEFAEDGWTNDVLRQANVNYDPIKKCDERFQPYTMLGGNGAVWLNPFREGVSGVKCKARAIYHKDDWYYNASSWVEIGTAASTVVFNSDFVHTHCVNATNRKEIVEDFVHLQMWNATDDGGAKINVTTINSTSLEEEEEEVDEKPSVFIFVLDSVANSQARRSLPKTISLLHHEFDAVNLRHVNKVGENSHPNGIAFLIGKLITDLDKGIFGMGKENADWNETYACDRYFDDDPFILKEFTKVKGYKSLIAEDWAHGVFNFPNCKGFEHAPATHYMSNGTHVDSFFFKFFRNVWTSQFDESFVYFMGDHGIRWGPVNEMWIGKREINNPMMFVSVPRHMRDRIHPVLKENSGKLLTSFDIYASLVDILNEPHLKGDVGPSGIRGNSFFRSLPPGERSCRTLPIPFRFCLCEWNKTKSENVTVNGEIGIGSVKLLNLKLKDLHMDTACEKFTLNKTIEVKMIDRTDGLAEVVFTVNECGGQFKTIVRAHRMAHGLLNITLAASDFTRSNSYGKTAECMKSRPSLRPLCCCR
ncbi:hypothetical protein PRIPAC_80676 [Pristionchus pacificus]|uniref:Uncharacterized protein n=1 Tax=Pristionchus pacificus TaxID=54126 RepID=A0A2A6CP92_PRIPA|nr:hypothetical protein PRIPAC_80676 [Pristionchus pacificus]|eukprot:PDM80014.1 hypothetical protein PRIPAC_32593 [Pristionchus pacificus]